MNFLLKWFALNITERNLSALASVEDDTEEKASKCELQSNLPSTCKFIVKAAQSDFSIVTPSNFKYKAQHTKT